MLKGDFSKFLEKPHFGTYHARVRFFSTELQNVEVCLTLLKCDFTTYARPAILKFLRTNKGSNCSAVKSVFGMVKGGWIGLLESFKRNAIKDISLIIFQNFDNINFSNVPLKNVLRDFF